MLYIAIVCLTFLFLFSARAFPVYLVGLISSCVFEAVFILLGFCITDSVWDSFGYYMYKNVSALPKDQGAFGRRGMPIKLAGHIPCSTP